MGFFKSKKFKNGTLAVVFTAAVIALVILINAAISAAAGAGMWYFDMTKEGVYTLSDATKEILEPVDAEVNILFAKDEDAALRFNRIKDALTQLAHEKGIC